MSKFSATEVAFLDKEGVGRMAQIGSDNLPHATPLCYASSEDAVYIETGISSWKIRNLKKSPDVAFVVDEYFDDWSKLRGIRMLGRGEVLVEGSEYEEGKKLLFGKYPAQMKNLGWVDGTNVVIKITPTKVTSWGV